MVYMAKVDDASTNDGSGLSWFKVAEEGLDTTTSKWGVDSKLAYLESRLHINVISTHRWCRSLVLHNA